MFFRSAGHIFGIGFIGLAFYWYMMFKWPTAVVTLIADDDELNEDMYKNWVSCLARTHQLFRERCLVTAARLAWGNSWYFDSRVSAVLV